MSESSHEHEPVDFTQTNTTPVEPAPTDIYQYEKAAKNPSRFQAALVATLGFVIFGGLVGGGAFAMTGGLPGILPGAPADPSISSVDPSNTANDPAAIDPLLAPSDPSATDPASTDAASTDPASTDAASTDSAATDPASNEANPSPSDTQIVVPPVFNAGDGEGDNKSSNGDGNADHNGKSKGEGHHKPRPSVGPNPTATIAPPVFSNSGDDSGSETEAPDDN